MVVWLHGVLPPESVAGSSKWTAMLLNRQSKSYLISLHNLIISGLFSALEMQEDALCFANGIQNTISSSHSENLIQPTGFAGVSTDISVFIAQLCRGNTENAGRLVVLLLLHSPFGLKGSPPSVRCAVWKVILVWPMSCSFFSSE